MERRATLVFHHGTILTMEEKDPESEAVAIAGDRIVEVGENRDVLRLKARGTRVIDLRGRCLLPGFIDAHSHLTHYGLDLLRLDLSSARSLEGALRRVKRAALRVRKSGWLVAHSFDETTWSKPRLFTAADLDRVAPGRRVLLRRVDGHTCIVSTAALAGLRLAGVKGVEMNAGKPVGVLREDAVDVALAAVPHDLAQASRGFRLACQKMHALGVTSVAETVEAPEIATYSAAAARGERPIRAHMKARETLLDDACRRGRSGDAWLRHGAVKLYTDGSLGSHTAALSEPFADDRDNRGMLIYDDAKLGALVAKAHDAGLQACLHAIGDRAISQSLHALHAALRRLPRADHRHRLEHFMVASPDHIAQARRLGVVASVQPNFLGRWGQPGGMYERRLGKARARRLLPMREMLDADVPLAFGSDGMPYGPLFGLHSAVNARFPAQRLSVDEALAAYTRGAAFACSSDEFLGTISPGKLADLVVLSRDPRKEPKRIDRLKVATTVLGGKVVLRA